MDGEVEGITADEVADGATDVVVAIVAAMVQNLSRSKAEHSSYRL